jgi:hypothetical protein
MVSLRKRRGVPLTIAAAVGVVFGLLSIYAAGMVLFGPQAAQQGAGAHPGFVVWFNFLSGFAYVLAGHAVWNMRPWGAWLALFILASIAAVALGFGIHAASGGAYEIRTVAALGLRFVVWLVIASMGYVTLARPR